MAKKADKIKKMTKQIVALIEEEGIFIEKIILFGSYAHGTQTPFSDIDLAIISPQFNHMGLVKRQELLAELLFPLGEPIEALGYSSKELKKVKPYSFFSEILSTGKIIYNASAA